MPSIPAVAEATKQGQTKTHYEVLELARDASLKDVKKAYRRLAVLHHPDRNLGNEEEATVKFREISEAYEVLSDEDARRDYDAALKFGRGRADGGDFGRSFGDGGRGRRHPRRGGPHRDPFDQFKDVFQNDPFFAEASKSMDDLFHRHFSGDGRNAPAAAADGNDRDDGVGGWIWNTVKNFMPNIEVHTSTTTNFGGSQSHSSTSRSYGGGRSGGGRSGSSRASRITSSRAPTSTSSHAASSSSTYTSRSTRTVMQNGRRVTIQSLEKDGNKIEEKYVGDKLIERKINGMKDDSVGRIEEL